MRTIVLVKQRAATDGALVEFAQLGGVRGHEVCLLDKAGFLESDANNVDCICLKNHLDADKVWRKIAAIGARAVNPRLAHIDRSSIDACLHGAGIDVPYGGITAAEVRALRGPIVRKSRDLFAQGQVQVFDAPPENIDVDHDSHQTLVAGDGITRKAYVIGDEAFLVLEHDATGKREACPMPPRLAAVAYPWVMYWGLRSTAWISSVKGRR